MIVPAPAIRESVLGIVLAGELERMIQLPPIDVLLKTRRTRDCAVAADKLEAELFENTVGRGVFSNEANP